MLSVAWPPLRAIAKSWSHAACFRVRAMGPRKALEMRAMTRKAAEAAGDTLQGDAPDVQKDASDEAIGALIERFVES